MLRSVTLYDRGQLDDYAIDHRAHIPGNTYRYVPSQQWLSVTTDIHKYRLQTEKSL